MIKPLLLSLAGVFLFWSCTEQEEVKSNNPQKEQLNVMLPEALKGIGKKSSKARIEAKLEETLNATLFSKTPFKISEVHVCTMASVDKATSVETIDQQFESTLPSRWVPGDRRRDWNGDKDLNDIDWLSFTPFAIANDSIDTESTYEAMYNKWETETYCRNVNIDRTPYNFLMGNPSVILEIGGLPTAEQPLADVAVIGFLPAELFETLLGSENVLGVAFSFVFIDPETGEPTKTTRGKEDKAFTEVWFNDGFPWAFNNQRGYVDLESIILHEFGHTLNLGHFGILQQFNNEDGSVDFSYQPVNTMNAIYFGEPRNFLGQNDKGNFCEAWGSWPWN